MIATAVHRTVLLILLVPAHLAGLNRHAAGEALPAEPGIERQTIAGWVENVWLYAGSTRLSIQAKLDTGAESASINNAGLRNIERDGAPWVAFSLADSRGQRMEIEAPVTRLARIRRAGAAVAERPVIDLGLCIAGHTETVEFTLADRSGMDYQILVGRNFLANRLLVDSGRSYIAPDTCAMPFGR